jgi:very-short-patch-repair endonuclease
MDDPILRRLARIAQPQAGCLHTRQLHAAAISDDQISSLISRGALMRICHTVYLFGASRLSDAALLRAACLRAGPRVRVAEQTALAVLGLVSFDPSRVVVWIPRRSTTTATTIKVTTLAPTESTGRPATIEIRARRRLGAAQYVGDLPVSETIDALIGLAARGHSAALSRAWREADFRSMLSVDAVEARLGRGIEGSSVIRELMNLHPIVGADTTLLSRAERRLLGGIARRGMGQPAVNRPIEFAGQILRPDFFYFDEQLAVEVLGGGHDSPARQLEDLERIRIMRSVGVDVLEFSDTEIWRDLEACLDHLDARLRGRRPRRRAAA